MLDNHTYVMKSWGEGESATYAFLLRGGGGDSDDDDRICGRLYRRRGRSTGLKFCEGLAERRIIPRVVQGSDPVHNTDTHSKSGVRPNPHLPQGTKIIGPWVAKETKEKSSTRANVTQTPP